MSRFVTLFLVPLLLVAPASLVAQAPPEVVAKVADEGRNDSLVMEHLDHLTNQIGPRLTGSERLTRACEWARDRFRSFGLENARLEEWGTVDVGFDRGTHQGFMKAEGSTRAVTFGTNAWTPGTDGLQEGRAILGPMDEDGVAEFRSKAKGAWVVRPSRSTVRGQINEICTEVNALGVVGNGGDLIITSGNHGTKWDSLPKLVRINLLKADFDDLVKRLDEGQDVRLAFDVQNRFKQGPIPLYNVIADIPGTEKPDEFVIVGGHIDSWDGATGTTDNGTGVATTLEAARLLMAAGAKPRRTIRFMLWSGEEQGLLGSVAYIRNHPDELERISAVLVHDGGTNYVSGIVSTEQMLPGMKKALAPVIKLIGEAQDQGARPSASEGESRPAAEAGERLKFSISDVGRLPIGIGSDHDAFLARGVPGFFWRQAGRANYNRTHHTQHDTYDAAIPEYQRHSSIVIALGALGIANLDEKLPRSKDMTSRPSAATNRRRLGVQLGGEADDLTIDSIVEGSRAEKAGLKPGDRIVKIDGVPVKERREMTDALQVGAPKKVITFLRDKREHEITVEFSAPESRPQ